MNRSLTLLFAILLFLGGALAGRQIMTPDPGATHSPPNPTAEPSVAIDSPSAIATSADDLTPQSTSENGNIRFAGFEQPVEAVAPVALTDEEIRTEIEKRFPDLTQDTVAGWIAAYRGSTEDELRGLLNERQMLKGLFPVRSFPSPTSDEQSESEKN